MAFSVLLDANVLFSIRICDLLLTAADARLYRPLWSEQILGEACRNAAARYPNVAAAIQGRFDDMRSAFPDALVTGHEPLIGAMTNDSKDRHVLAAAVVGRADLLVSENTRHFPAASRAPYNIDLQTADEFLQSLWSLDRNGMVACIEEVAAKRKRLTSAGLRSTGTLIAEELRARAPRFSEEAWKSGLLS